jgi:phosphatidylglycerophosphate synthase
MTRLSLEEARRLGQGSSHLDADPTYARRFVRRFSPIVSWTIATRTPLSADAVTLLAIAAGTAGGLLVGLTTPATSLAAIVLLQLAYLLDVVDGEVARIRGTAGTRGTYLDLIGHFVQNRALYAGAAFSLVDATDGAVWAIGVGFLVLGFSTPFGVYARQHVLGGGASPAHPDHAPRDGGIPFAAGAPASWPGWAYRQLAFLWNYPASMNLFSLALAVDVVRGALGSATSLAVPVLVVVFGSTLAAKQVVNAARLAVRWPR